MGLYGQRVGCFHYIASPSQDAEGICKRVASQLAIVVRSEMSSPPTYGAKIAATVLNDKKLFLAWKRDIQTMAQRLAEVRHWLRYELERLGTLGSWKHLTDQVGMFALTGLSPEQALSMRMKHHIFMPSTGRISVADLNSSNVKYVAAAIDDVTKDK